MEGDTFFHFYQTLSTEDENSRSASEKADCKRKIAAQVECLSKTNRDCANFYVLDQHLVSYANIVDEKDTTSGLNNYAAGALALTSTSKNESKSWSISSLASSDRFRALQSCVQNKTDVAQKLRKKLDEAYVTLQHKSTAPIVSSFRKSASVGDYDSMKPQTNRDIPKFANQVNNSWTTTGGPNSARKPFPTSPDHVTNQRSDASSAKENPTYGGHFRTARDQLIIENQQKNNNHNSCSSSGPQYAGNVPSRNKSLGTRRGLKSPFVPPIKETSNGDSCELNGPKQPEKSADELQDPRLKNIEPKMVELIENEIMDHGPPTTWDHIAGLEFAKATIKEIVVWPMLRPDIFTGLRGPPRGILLFGPPGTGKTLIGKCIASQSHSTFFSISASSLTSKWVGDGEKMVRALFAVARVHQPSVIFIDEIDSLLSQRSDTEHESSRRIKTEFLVQLDGATTSQEDRLLVVGATNRPQELDEAARRRLVKRLYIPLPEMEARKQIIRILMESQHNSLSQSDINEICSRTDGYSGADMTNLCREAALGPIRAIPMDQIEHISPDQVRPICYDDFLAALNQVKASVSDEDLALYEDWNRRYGSVSK